MLRPLRSLPFVVRVKVKLVSRVVRTAVSPPLGVSRAAEPRFARREHAEEVRDETVERVRCAPPRRLSRSTRSPADVALAALHVALRCDRVRIRKERRCVLARSVPVSAPEGAVGGENPLQLPQCPTRQRSVHREDQWRPKTNRHYEPGRRTARVCKNLPAERVCAFEIKSEEIAGGELTGSGITSTLLHQKQGESLRGSPTDRRASARDKNS